MKGFCIWILCFCLLCTPVRADSEKLVALTFDDGPSGKYTRKLLDGLKERDARATFLLCGYRMEQYPELTERIFMEGHEIGLHGYSHKSMQNMCCQEVTEEIERCMQWIPDDCRVRFLRPPGGQCGTGVQKATTETELAILSWSVDPKDWATDDGYKIQKQVIRNTRDGDIILLHDMSYSSVSAAFAIIDGLQKQGFRFVTVSELAMDRKVTLIPGNQYTHFRIPQERK